MRIPIRLPDLGTDDETIRICGWSVELGERVLEGDRIAEVSIPGVVFDVESTAAGQLVEICCSVDQTIECGAVLCWIEIDRDSPPDKTT